MNYQELATMIAKIDKKYELLLKMKELTVQQEACLGKDDDCFEALLNSKDEIIKEIDAIDSSFYDCFQRFKSDNGISDLSELNKAELEQMSPLIQSVNRVEGLVIEIAELDKKNFDVATKIIDGYKDELKKVRSGRKIKNVYNSIDTDGIIYDEKG